MTQVTQKRARVDGLAGVSTVMNDLIALQDTADGIVCDLSTGRCGPDQGETRQVTVTYVTDPICSACWAMEPAWRAAQLRYGDGLDVRHVYGGLLPSWEGFADEGNGIRSFRDVGVHWREMGEHTGQAIDASVWETDPIASSFPPSLVLVAARDVAPDREELVLRRLREQLFAHGRNIASQDVWAEALQAAGIGVDAVVARLRDGRAQGLFVADLQLARQLRASAFPTLIVEADGDRTTLRGVQSVARLDRLLAQAAGVQPTPHDATIEEAVAHLGLGTTAEYAAVMGTDHQEAERRLATTDLRARTLSGGTVWLP